MNYRYHISDAMGVFTVWCTIDQLGSDRLIVDKRAVADPESSVILIHEREGLIISIADLLHVDPPFYSNAQVALRAAVSLAGLKSCDRDAEVREWADEEYDFVGRLK